MTGLFIGLLLFVPSVFSAVFQDAPNKERIRFFDRASEMCEIVSADAEGVTLKLEGLPKATRFTWAQLDPEDARTLQLRYVGKILDVSPPSPVPGAPKKERVRFLDHTSEMCEIVSTDADGVTLKLDGIPKPVRFKWWQIHIEDATILRDRLLGKIPQPVPGELTMAGIRVVMKDKRTYEGVALVGGPPGEFWLKNSEGKFVFKNDAVAAREEIVIDLRRVYTPDELFGILMGRMQPVTPDQFDRLGTELVRLKLEDRALAAFKMAELLRHPDWPESKMYRDLVKLRELITDISLKKGVFDVQESYLSGDYDAAISQIDALEKALAGQETGPYLMRELQRLRAQIQESRAFARDEQIVQEWYRAIEGFLKMKAMERTLTFGQAVKYVEERMPEEVQEHVRGRFNFSPKDPTVKAAWDRRPANIMFKHSYDEGSWPVLRPQLRDPRDWWEAANDVTRYSVLKGIYVENHMQVLEVRLKSCGSCGGTGQVESAKFPDSAGGICPACLGLKSQRVIVYR